jgi:hypothetical protein
MGGYVGRSDAALGLAVWCWLGSEVSAAQWTQHLADMQVLRSWARPGVRPCVLLHLVDNGFIPNAQQRRQIAEISALPDYTPSIAVLTTNPVVRGVIQALTWLQAKQAYRIQAFKHLNDAIAWLETERAAALPALVPLLQQAHRALGLDADPAQARS